MGFNPATGAYEPDVNDPGSAGGPAPLNPSGSDGFASAGAGPVPAPVPGAPGPVAPPAGPQAATQEPAYQDPYGAPQGEVTTGIDSSYSGVKNAQKFVKQAEQLKTAEGAAASQYNQLLGQEGQQADAVAAQQLDAAKQQTDIAGQRMQAEHDARQQYIDLQAKFAVEQKRQGDIAQAHSQAAVARYQQQADAVAHMEINPTAGQDTAYKAGSTVALFAQGFLAARYGINVDAQGVLNGWVDRTVQMQKDKIAQGQQLADADKTMWDMARSEATDQQDELDRVQGLLLKRADAQVALTASMLAGPQAQADFAAKRATIASNLADVHSRIANTAYGVTKDSFVAQNQALTSAIDASRFTASSRKSFDQVKTAPVAPVAADPLSVSEYTTDPKTGEVYPVERFKMDPEKAKQDTTAAHDARIGWINAQAVHRHVLAIQGMLAKAGTTGVAFSSEDQQLLKNEYDQLTALRVQNGTEKNIGRNQKLLDTFNSSVGNIGPLHLDAVDVAKRSIASYDSAQLQDAAEPLAPFVVEGSRQRTINAMPQVQGQALQTVGKDQVAPQSDAQDNTSVYGIQPSSAGMTGAVGDAVRPPSGDFWARQGGNPAGAPEWEHKASKTLAQAARGNGDVATKAREEIKTNAERNPNDPKWGPIRAHYFQAAARELGVDFTPAVDATSSGDGLGHY